ncbi:MAG: hypothetical protein LBK70_03115, partial [Clostridiales bacterium]|nr:hypothetical protein [Clostridiales bacterium]
DCYHHSNLSLSYSANAGGHTAKCHLCNQTIYNSHSFGGGVDRYQSCTTCGYMVDSWTDTITARIAQRPYISSLLDCCP